MLSSLLLALIALAPSQQEEPRIVFRTSTEAVQVDVFVGRRGEVLLGLAKDDFELYDNGQSREIELMDVTKMPLKIALLLDTSVSVKGTRLEDLQAAAHVFLDELEEKDSVTLVTFSQQLNLTEGDTPQLHESIDAVEPNGWTSWYDALFAGLKTVEGTTDRPVVLLFTDGDDTSSWLRQDQILKLIEESNAVVYAVYHEEQSNGVARKTAGSARNSNREITSGTDLLRELTRASGGRLVETDSTDRLQETFLDILTEMKTRYVLIYSPLTPIAEGWHDIEVKVRTRGAEVNARRGYFYESRR